MVRGKRGWAYAWRVVVGGGEGTKSWVGGEVRQIEKGGIGIGNRGIGIAEEKKEGEVGDEE